MEFEGKAQIIVVPEEDRLDLVGQLGPAVGSYDEL